MTEGRFGEKLYEGVYPVVVDLPNDDNGHLHFDHYGHYLDFARDKFLTEFGWSDKYLQDNHCVSMVLRGGKYAHKREVNSGDNLDISLKVHFLKNPLFHMVYHFRRDGGLLYINESRWAFVDNSTQGHVDVPRFFLDALRAEPKR